ncbi:WxL domain-containing protein [Enterococcus sp. DIV0996a]|uniref:WxL domain-containing protein n=1 Tax=Enterococcus sp. DIV0996a TaxID=2774790 RepID=UPI003F26AC74
MPARLRRSVLLLGTAILMMHLVSTPFSMVYGETTLDTEEQEQVELPPVQNSLEELFSDTNFFFPQSQLQGKVEEPLQVTFFSDKEVSEARVILPKEATIIKEQLPEGISVEEGEYPNEWSIHSKRAQTMFDLPLVFNKAGSYELSVEETTTHVEISEQEETSEETPFEETEFSDEDSAGQEDLKEEENGIEEDQENEQSAEDVREPVAEAPQEQQTDEEETDEAIEEPTVFDGETAEVTTMAQFRAAVANSDIGIISVQANLTEATANVLTVDRPLLIQGNGYTLTFGINGFYFQLAEVVEPSAFRIENTRLTKVGITPLINATVESSKNWTVELENITEVNANTMRLASLPEGNIHFTGGVSNFTRTASAQNFIVAKEVVATNQAEVTISRGNAAVFFSSTTVANPKFTVEQGATVTITTTAGSANTIDLRGENSEIVLRDNGQLTVNTIGIVISTTPTNTINNAIALTGLSPKISISEKSRLSVRSTLSKRGIHLAGTNAQIHVANSELTVVSTTQTAVNISGEAPLFSAENSTVQLTSTTGQRINLSGSEPTLTMKNSQLNMNASTGTGINLQGATPQVLMDNSQLLMTDTEASWGILLTGTDALFSLSNQSEVHLTGAGTGTTENIRIGNNNARPELSVTDGSTLSVTTTSGTTAATDTANNAIHLLGDDPKTTITDGSELKVSVNSGARRGLFLNGNNAELSVNDTNLNIKTVNGTGISLNGSEQKFQIIGKDTNVNLLSDGGMNFESQGAGGTFLVTNGAKINAQTSENHSFYFYNSGETKFEILDKAKVLLKDTHSGNSNTTSFGTLRFVQHGDYSFIIDDADFEINKNGGNAPGVRMYGGGNSILVRNSGTLSIFNQGSGSPLDPIDQRSNQGVFFSGDNNTINNNGFTVQDPGSKVSIQAINGPSIDMSNRTTRGSGYIEAINGGYFVAEGRTTSANAGIFHAGILTVKFDNPLFMDFRNNRPGGGNIFSNTSGSRLEAKNSDLAVWRNGSNLAGDPDLNFETLDFSFSGTNFNTLGDTSKPEVLNTDTFGTTGLTAYSRLSSNNGRWAIADELRVPTNADKKIHGRVSLPVGLDDSRPAWDGEAIVTVAVESPSGETTQEYTAQTVGDTNESPGISIYDEEPRGGLFEIDLDEPLEAGSKVRISKVELTSGELTDGFEHQILTGTVEVFPIIPPTPAQFSSSIIAQNSTMIQGVTDNLDAEVTATHNGKPLNTETVKVDPDGRFRLNLSEVSLEMDDEIQVFLRDAEGSAEAASIINPPETNNDRGNINPDTELTFHDVTFEPATTLIVGDIGPVSPVDPLDPEIEVTPENPPVLPEEQGPLSIDFASRFNFGEQNISVKDKTYYAQPQRLLNEDGTVNETQDRPNYIQISDRRPESKRNGWELAVTQNEQFKGKENQMLNGASLILSNQQVVTAQGGTEPGLQFTVPCRLVPGNRRTLLKAQGNEGTGTWIYRFGDSETAGESVSLYVPKGTNPEATSYSTTLTWELSAVPDN